MYELARPAIYSYSIQRGTPHVNLRQKRASLFNSQILVVALIGIFGGLKPKMCVHFSKDWRSGMPHVNWHQKLAPKNNPANSPLALSVIFGGLNPKIGAKFSNDLRSDVGRRIRKRLTPNPNPNPFLSPPSNH